MTTEKTATINPKAVVSNYFNTASEMNEQLAWVTQIIRNVLRKLSHLKYEGPLTLAHGSDRVTEFQLFQDSHISWDRKILNRTMHTATEEQKKAMLEPEQYNARKHIRCVLMTAIGGTTRTHLDIPLSIFYTRNPIIVAQWARKAVWKHYDERIFEKEKNLLSDIRETREKLNYLGKHLDAAQNVTTQRVKWKQERAAQKLKQKRSQ